MDNNDHLTYITYSQVHRDIITSGGVKEIDQYLATQSNAEKRSLLFCLDQYLDPYYRYNLIYHDKIISILEKQLFQNHTKEVKEDMLQLLNDYATKPLLYLAEHIDEIEPELRPDALHAVQNV